MNKKIVTIISVIAVVLLGIKGKSLLNKRKDEIKNEPTPKAALISTQIVSPKIEQLSQKSSFVANLLGDKSIKLSTKLAGYINKVYVEESQTVQKGDTLVSIDSTELKANMESAKSALLAIKSDYLTAKNIYLTNVKLYKVGGLPKEKLELSKVALEAKKANYTAAQEKIKSIENQLSYLTIKAPFSGKIDTVFLHEGDLAVTGKPIISMSNNSQKMVFSFTPLKDHITKNQTVLYHDTQIGNIKSIYNTTRNSLATAEIKLSRHISLPLGSDLPVEIITKQQKGCVLPDNTVLHKKDGDFVMSYHDEIFSPLKVKVMIHSDNKVLISPCPKTPVAKDSEVKLAKLPALGKVTVTGENNE